MSDEENGEVADNTRDFTEVTYDSWGSKMKDSCAGVLIGFLLFFGSGALLFWNEGRAISRAKDLDDGKETVLSVNVVDLTTNPTSSSASSATATTATTATTNYDRKLIHIVGPVTASQTVVDPIFGVSAGKTTTTTTSNNNQTSTTTSATTGALKLRRTAEMFQWIERTSTTTSKTAAGGTRKETTYSYDKTWSPYLIDSYQFKQRQVPENPTSFRYGAWEMTGEPLLLADVVQLSQDTANRINWWQDVTGLDVADIPDATLRATAQLYGQSGYYVGGGSNQNPNQNGTTTTTQQQQQGPVIGAERVEFQAVPADTVSIVGIYRTAGSGSSGSTSSSSSSSVGAFATERGGTILLVSRGVYTADEMFAQAEAENEATTWGLRFVGFVLMFISVLLILQPFATFVDIIPFVGDCMQEGMECCLFPTVAFLVAAPISLFIIALAWVVYRPQIAIPLLVVSLAAICFCCVRARNKKEELDSQQMQQQQMQQSQLHSQQGQVPVAYATPYGGQQQQPPQQAAYEPDVAVGSGGGEADVPVGDMYKPDWAK